MLSLDTTYLNSYNYIILILVFKNSLDWKLLNNSLMKYNYNIKSNLYNNFKLYFK